MRKLLIRFRLSIKFGVVFFFISVYIISYFVVFCFVAFYIFVDTIYDIIKEFFYRRKVWRNLTFYQKEGPKGEEQWRKRTVRGRRW